MKVDSTTLISSTMAGQVSNQKDEEKLKSFAEAMEKAKEDGDADELKKVSQQFEAFFVNEIFKSMRKASDIGEGLIEKSHARGMYESMYDQELADKISEGRGIGIADLIYKRMSAQYSIGNSTSKEDTDESDKSSEKKTVQSIDLKG